ncbi:hypothetical protein SEA_BEATUSCOMEDENTI_93 [Arthrobacter phage BeatusComedenti]|uniref:Uncharacterized protein n=1 Tax=Arthrobacter phage BeatusComedenti TaxID=2656523 RepID=A0A649VX67_9CAUD|nr:hypothetical protein SEA_BEATUSCOMEDENTI_93 [Arthrobacter phage BeatusComedenti]
MAFEKKALKELLARLTPAEAARVLNGVVDALPDELDYADTNSKDVADGMLELISHLPKPGMAVTSKPTTRGITHD